MDSFAVILREYWGQLHLIQKGVWLILLACSLVAFGSPMPAKITWLEMVMGSGLLIGGILLTGAVIREVRQQKTAKWCLGLTALLFIIPLCVGLMRGNAMHDIARDIFPLAFLLMVPILLIYSASSASRAMLRMLITVTLVFVGIGTAITFFMGALNLVGTTDRMWSMMRGNLGLIEASWEFQASQTSQASQASQAFQAEFGERTRKVFLKLYDPAMLFAAIFFSAWGVVLIVRSWHSWLQGIILAGMGALIAYGFMILGLRAHTVFFALAIVAICLSQCREWGFYVRLLPVIFVACVLLLPQIETVLHLLWIKQQVVGVNGKVIEWWAVITLVFSSSQTALFGVGWGGVLSNPIYLNETTRFTHSVLSFYLLKSGVLGLIALLSVIAILLFEGRRLEDSGIWTSSRQIMLASCLPPLLIGVLFQPSYKMLSYGVILALLILLSVPIESERNRINGQK